MFQGADGIGPPDRFRFFASESELEQYLVFDPQWPKSSGDNFCRIPDYSVALALLNRRKSPLGPGCSLPGNHLKSLKDRNVVSSILNAWTVP